ncbi:hypothetical protein GGI07_002823 [Coemansia sp. Benny D115]|nr:hypothetical protein GGI07_002823 [Coemansia sp. Benny D115]
MSTDAISFAAKVQVPPLTSSKQWSEALAFNNTFTEKLPGDKVTTQSPYADDSTGTSTPLANFTASRQVHDALWSWAVATPQPNPRLISHSTATMQLLDLPVQLFEKAQAPEAAQVLCGNYRLPGSQPWAHCYGGHQFGSWADQLGDGRALSLGQTKGCKTPSNPNSIWELQLKGAGRTPYSRFGDGLAVRRSSVREYLAAEHLHALGIPTTRSLALVFTDKVVEREESELGAVVTRVAPSWIRFGSFELPASRRDRELLRKLADYVIENWYPEVLATDTKQKGCDRYAGLLEAVVERTALMVAKWQAVGFCHGVMNTDNMSILGLTLDYGPFAFLDAYDPSFICNHSDPAGRYAFNEQPRVAHWNCLRLAGPLTMLMDKENVDDELSSETIETLTRILGGFGTEYRRQLATAMLPKFGLTEQRADQARDLADIVQPFLNLLARGQTDYTFAMRALCSIPGILWQMTTSGEATSDSKQLLDQHIDILAERSLAFASSSPSSSACRAGEKSSDNDESIGLWKSNMRDYYLSVYMPRLAKEEDWGNRGVLMKQANPRFVLRNWVAQDIIERIDRGEEELVDRVLALFTQHVYDDELPVELADLEKYSGPVPDWGQGLQCSCSS